MRYFAVLLWSRSVWNSRTSQQKREGLLLPARNSFMSRSVELLEFDPIDSDQGKYLIAFFP